MSQHRRCPRDAECDGCRLRRVLDEGPVRRGAYPRRRRRVAAQAYTEVLGEIYRTRRHWSIERMAARSGLSAATIEAIVMGERTTIWAATAERLDTLIRRIHRAPLGQLNPPERAAYRNGSWLGEGEAS